MLFSDLHKVLPSAAASLDPGDNQIRCELISPFLFNLWEGKVIYHELVTMLVSVTELSITPEWFKARATCEAFLIESQFHTLARNKEKYASWEFGAAWHALSIDDISLNAYSGWTIWPDKELIQAVMRLYKEEKEMEIWQLMWK